ncbi:polyprenyl diphosphate synthase [Candidatus Poseidoniales archaeon]|nr:polyprenyl diphosphate synthase [Candidatus Poseidoniales archaeon]MDB2333866.1 polyprenyl diphosphate synthase [Candidatus Poseidoniales archaeon]MDB2367324.1 polyprenyl diphosphate synthase [Candidatus Poseidoniales archaeon]MDB2671711.1 polyprenyl diphosphate synthase [Candidatus Poseidoniales archaeon]
MGISEKMGDVLGQAVEAKLFREVMEHDIQPKHLAIIMDGNRRFAWRSNLATHVGHRIGKQRLEAVLDWVLELGIPWFTVYALSTENLNRPEKELKILFKLYIDGLKSIADDPRIHENNVRVQIIGHRDLLPKDVNDAIDYAESETKDYGDFVFTVCLAYGAREEMIRAIQNIAELHANGNLPLESITQDTVSEHLYTAEMPDPDLVIRTSGEERISNFLLWQMAYSELYFTDVFWPSFKKKDLLKAVQTYQMRKRRFGE